MFNTKNVQCLLGVVMLLIINGCSSFSKLTDVGVDSTDGPIASDCSYCHVLQFKEWSRSRHASAYESSVFQAEYIQAGGDECLVCHAPLLVRNDESVPRPYNPAGGVDCISCHYSEGKMHGPHGASALFEPHPVEQNDEFYLGVSICLKCHAETVDEYNNIAKDQSLPNCLECHAASVLRTVSQGTNVFSNMLVSFEKQVETRSHEISLAAQRIETTLTPIAVTCLQDKGEQIEIGITNNLPHNLPTGTFGQKSIMLIIQFLRDNQRSGQATQLVADETQPISPGDSKKLRIPIPANVQAGGTMLIRIERYGAPADPRSAVRLASQSFALQFSTPDTMCLQD